MARKLSAIAVLNREELLAQYCAMANAARVLSEVLASFNNDDLLRDYLLSEGTFSLAGLLELNRRLIVETEHAALWLFNNEISQPSDSDPTDTMARINHLLESTILSAEDWNFVRQLEKYLSREGGRMSTDDRVDKGS